MTARPLLALALALAACASAARGKRLMVIANDEKVTWDETGNVVLHPPGRDTVCIFDLARPDVPAIVASLPLENSVFGPPSNVALTPDESLALVANSMTWTRDGEAWKSVPDTRVHVIDLRARPPRVLGTVAAGAQASGVDVNRAGTLALVANRAGKSVSVLRIRGRRVTSVGTVPIGDEVAAVAFTPDGRRALATKFAAGKVAVLEIEGEAVRYGGLDVAVGPWPYPIAVTPDGRLALTGDLGARTGSDGQVDTVSVIDLEQTPPVVIDRIEVGDGPEGLAISPDGTRAVVAILRGGNGDRSAPYHHRTGTVVALAIEGKKVTRLNEVEVGALPEGLVWSSDGRHVFVGNYLDRNVSILRFDDRTLVDTGTQLALPGQPAAMR